MPIYYFNVFNGGSVPDEDGTDLPDVYAAQDQAIRTSGEILQDLGARFWNGERWRLEVADEMGWVLFVLHFSAEERLRDGDRPTHRSEP